MKGHEECINLFSKGVRDKRYQRTLLVKSIIQLILKIRSAVYSKVHLKIHWTERNKKNLIITIKMK